jgi:disulfide bond formation protein DsbB
MIQLFQKYIALPRIGFLIAGFSAASLIGALVGQYGFDLKPCILCLIQRGPHAATVLLALFAAFAPPGKPGLKGDIPGILLALAGLSLLIGAGIAFFHTGVEQHWWSGLSACTGSVGDATDPAALRRQLLMEEIARCDQISWSLFGLSMAAYNFIASLCVGLFTLGAAWKNLPER